MQTKFKLDFDELPSSTSQEKGYNRHTGVHFKKPKVEAAERMFFCKLKPHAPSAPSDKPIKLTVWFGFGIKQKSKWGQYKTTRPDTDNYIKTFKDVMTKCGFWLDDAQVVDERTIKTFTESPFIWVEVEEVNARFGGIT